MRATGSPALATQALLARVCQMAYYEQLVKLEAIAIASTSFSSTGFIPTQWTGFAIAAVLLAAHFGIVAIATVLFLKYTRSSFIGNYWQAVSQVVSKDTMPILEKADRMKDEEVKRWVKSESLHLRRRSILRYQRDGRIALSMEAEDTSIARVFRCMTMYIDMKETRTGPFRCY
jgi:hypothetical protein